MRTLARITAALLVSSFAPLAMAQEECQTCHMNNSEIDKAITLLEQSCPVLDMTVSNGTKPSILSQDPCERLRAYKLARLLKRKPLLKSVGMMPAEEFHPGADGGPVERQSVLFFDTMFARKDLHTHQRVEFANVNGEFDIPAKVVNDDGETVILPAGRLDVIPYATQGKSGGKYVTDFEHNSTHYGHVIASRDPGRGFNHMISVYPVGVTRTLERDVKGVTLTLAGMADVAGITHYSFTDGNQGTGLALFSGTGSFEMEKKFGKSSLTWTVLECSTNITRPTNGSGTFADNECATTAEWQPGFKHAPELGVELSRRKTPGAPIESEDTLAVNARFDLTDIGRSLFHQQGDSARRKSHFHPTFFKPKQQQ